MEARLQWMTLTPKTWVHWEPLRGGLQAHALLARRYPQSECFVLEAREERAKVAIEKIAGGWWNVRHWTGPTIHVNEPAQPAQMLWANMALHMAADPQALIAQWSERVAPDGFLMFSCLGPDTLRELRGVYEQQGWPPASHAFTDMHDWGDMLVQAGFAEPVMDMERITLTFVSAQRLLAELRELGRNLHPQRFSALRGRAWLAQLHSALERGVPRSADGRLQLTFEVIYGHAFKPQPRMMVRPQTTVTLDAMRSSLRQGKKP